MLLYRSDSFESELAHLPSLSSAILSATQGAYSEAQLALDMSQGARVSTSAYKSAQTPTLSPLSSGLVSGFAQALARAEGAPQLLQPGALAARIRGGAAYVTSVGHIGAAGAIAADRQGRIATVSLGSPASVPTRIESALAAHRLVVGQLPEGQGGLEQLRGLLARRAPDELILVVQQPSTPQALVWCAAAGLSGASGRQTLTSQTTNQRGLIAAIDIAPTILDHLSLAIPVDMRGKPIEPDGALHPSRLAALKSRLGVLSSRRLPALVSMLAAWALLALLSSAPVGGPHARSRRRRAALRIGALAMMWLPVGVLVPAAVEPSRLGEFVMLVAVCFALGALTDRLVRWPRAPAVPALAAILVLSIDALAGTQLLMRSLLGPDPAFGARFYGIGNELKSGLAVLVLSGVAAVLYPGRRGRRAVVSMAIAGIVLAIVEGSARIGAGVGGVILVSAGTAVATVLCSEGGVDSKRALLIMAAPVIGLVALAAIDLATAHGSGHFTGSVLDARSPGDIRDIIVRRYGAAWDELKNHLMPFATALALLLGALGVIRRERLSTPVDGDPVWIAALAGGLSAGVIGMLSEDSGPVLLVVAVFVLGCVCGYLWGAPEETAETLQRTPRKGFSMRTEPIS